jgi:hypothetical protein
MQHATNEIAFASPVAMAMVASTGWTRWEGELVPPSNGDYQLKTYSNGRIKVWLDGKLVIDHWRQGWLTAEDQIKVHLEAGHHYPIKIESGGDQRSTMELTWKTPDPTKILPCGPTWVAEWIIISFTVRRSTRWSPGSAV